MDGVPIFSMFPLGLRPQQFAGLSGVLNSTTIVCERKSRKGRTFEEAIAAHKHGHSGNRCRLRFDGWDAAVKMWVMTIVLLGVPIRMKQVRRTASAISARKKYSLYVLFPGMANKLGYAQTPRQRSECSVQPELLARSDPQPIWKQQLRLSASTLDVFGLSTGRAQTQESKPRHGCWRNPSRCQPVGSEQPHN